MPESLRIQLGLPPVLPWGRAQFLAPKADTHRSVEKPPGAFPARILFPFWRLPAHSPEPGLHITSFRKSSLNPLGLLSFRFLASGSPHLGTKHIVGGLLVYSPA